MAGAIGLRGRSKEQPCGRTERSRAKSQEPRRPIPIRIGSFLQVPAPRADGEIIGEERGGRAEPEGGADHPSKGKKGRRCTKIQR